PSAGGTVWCAGPHDAAGSGSAGPRALSATGRGGRPHARRPARPGGADEAGRPGRGATRERVGDRRGRAGLVGVVDRVVGSVLPAATVCQGGRHVQRTLRPGRGKRGVAPRDHRGGTGAAGGDVRGEPVSAARVAHWLWGASAAARVARVSLIPLAGAYWAVMRLRTARARADAVRLPLPTIA